VTVAISCNLSDGVILAVDSAVTVPDATGGSIMKIYENAEKLFQLGERPIGVACYGLGALGNRTVGSYLAEFESRDPGAVLSQKNKVGEVVEALRLFLMAAYRKEVVPSLEKETGKKYKDIPPEERPALGLVIGGFSHGAFLSEVWHIIIPVHTRKGSSEQLRKQGSYGTNWFAIFEPVRRYIKGFDPALIDELIQWFATNRGPPLTPAEQKAVRGILDGHEYAIPFGAMPMDEGIQHSRFLAELVVSHHRYVIGAPVVGGRVHVGKVTYQGGRFQILDNGE
jgi:hypothetical protein